MTRPDLLTRALDALEAVLEACPQAGPSAGEFDVDRLELSLALQDAQIILNEAGRNVP